MYSTYFQWNKLREIGQAESDEQLDYVLKTMGVNQACTIVYTVS